MSRSEVSVLVVELPDIQGHPSGNGAYGDDGVLTSISRGELSKRAWEHQTSIEDAFADIAEDQIEHFRTLEDDEAVAILRDMVDSFIDDPLHCLTVPEATLFQLGSPRHSGSKIWIGVLHPLTENISAPPVRDLEDVTKYYWYHRLCAETIPLLGITAEPVYWTEG